MYRTLNFPVNRPAGLNSLREDKTQYKATWEDAPRHLLLNRCLAAFAISSAGLPAVSPVWRGRAGQCGEIRGLWHSASPNVLLDPACMINGPGIKKVIVY